MTTAIREYGMSSSWGRMHIVKRWKPNPNGCRAQEYVTMCGTAGSAYWKYTDETIGDEPICPKCEAKANR